jgi:hypothetical protein
MELAKLGGVFLLTAVLCVASAAASPSLVADSGSTTVTTGWDANSLVEAIMRSLGPLGILCFYLYYDITNSRPRRDREAKEEREKMTMISEARVDKLVASHDLLANTFSAALSKQADAFSLSTTRMADVHEKMIANCMHRSAGECMP